MMADLSGTSSTWWQLTVDAAQAAYQRWIYASPVDRLRLRVTPHPQAGQWPRTSQRAVTLLLAAIPEDLRRELISQRTMDAPSILFKLFTTFQPGGPQERTKLLASLTMDSCSNNTTVVQLLEMVRLWR
eukprot:Skav215160  [mRNA]  locus=scaffold2298:163:549:- [translate_table: standard]